MRRSVSLLITTLLLCSAGIGAADLEVRLRRYVMVAPGDLEVTIVVERDKNNRYLTIEADSVVFYRSSLIELAGDTAPKTHLIRYQNLPEGEYRIRVVLGGERTVLARIEQAAQVRGRRTEPRPSAAH